VFFSLCVAGFVVWMRPDFWRDWKSAAAVSLAPLVGALLWGVIFELTKPAVPIYDIVTHLRPRSALGALFYGDLEKSISLLIETDRNVNASESNREQSGISRRQFCGIKRQRQFFEVPLSVSQLRGL
jgi:hypothetical protein